MNLTPTWKAYNTKDGKLHIVNADAFRAYIKSFGEKTFQLVARKTRKPRSNNQNSYYWGVVLSLIYDHTGHSLEELHEAFKYKFLKKFNSDGLEFVQSTTDLTTTGMMEYIENIKRFAAEELDIVIPDPDRVIPE
jgi:hypothetical protein